MLKHKIFTIFFLSLPLLLASYEKAVATEATNTPVVTEIMWEDLIPKEWRPDQTLVDKYNNGEIGDDDPRIIKLKKRFQEMEKLSPLNKKLHGKFIKMPGLVVPVELDGEKVRELLLVPYHGACVHVPPPPANQVVYVKLPDKLARKFEYFETIWVTGLLTVEKTKSKVAEAGYSIKATKVELYE
ncbi:MAG: DUF3299 domain-containing protein [Gammaproteobacteria bacterium]|nr:DUF3299 domain-containing protein [Gammaproteobacteria bacterium]